MINILAISHSNQLAKAAVGFVSEMKNDKVVLNMIAGINGGKDFGTDVSEIIESIKKTNSGDGVIIICDLGSSIMNAQMAIEMLDEDISSKVRIADACFVEGLLVAVTSVRDNVSIDDLVKEIEAGSRIKKIN